MMVLVFSGSANESKHVAREVLYAGDNQKPVLPFRVQDTVPTGGIAYYLLGVQWLDAWSPPLEPHLDVLVSRVRRLLSNGTAPAPPPAVPEIPPLPQETDIPFQCGACGELMVIEAAGKGLQVDCLGCGRPVTVPGAAKPAPPLAPGVRDAIAERLGSILGPIAPHLVKTVSAEASTLPDLCQKLAAYIPDQKDRAAFLTTFLPGSTAGPAPEAPAPPATETARQISPAAWSPEVLETLKNGLAVYLGPMSGLLVEQTARQARTLNDLHELLAAKISSPKDREKWKKSVAGSHA